MFQELKRLIEQMGKDKGIDKSIITEALEAAMMTAARKKLGQNVDIEAHYNDEAGEIEVFQFKTVVDNVLDPEMQISKEEARRTLDEGAEPGDSLGMKIETSSFGRIAVQMAKQIIIQRVKDAERDNIYDEYKDRKGELINGFVQRFEGGNIIVNLGRAEGLVPPSEQISRETYKRGERIRSYLFEVKKNTKGAQIILSRTHPAFLKALFEVEVPEISEGLIDIVSVAREPGKRGKIAVKARDKDIDPVGACVGMRGTRVQSVVQELRGEKIDIIPYTEDSAKFVSSALSPAKVNRVFVDEENRAMMVIVPDDQLSLAIGKNGQNVRLAVKLTGWKIDVKSETMAAEKDDSERNALTRISGMEPAVAEKLSVQGIKSIAMLAALEPDALSAMSGAVEKTCAEWIAEAIRLLDEETGRHAKA
ncbi:MAG: transcription termination/antitermination protein NusA [Syntrophaceae bacterium]|jgi:transcription termination/antitermination protein NusA|nr:transcription termination/antitermination protein NusA [Syntrophaceae bacterium]HQM44813.1 transcription termination factor NusA [Smithellaceae bacterium]